jgi:hypothetical protein
MEINKLRKHTLQPEALIYISTAHANSLKSSKEARSGIDYTMRCVSENILSDIKRFK